MTADKLLEIARKYIGITENPPNSNCVIFNTIYYGQEVSGSKYLWCMAFQWCLFREAGASALFFNGAKTASCGALMRYAQYAGQWVTDDYQPGDLAIFDFEEDGNLDTNHVGMVEGSEGAYITTIDGNTGTTSEANGGAVMRRTRELKYVVGAYRPKYEEARPVTKNEAKEIVKIKAGLSDASIQYIADDYRWGDELIVKLAEAMK